MRRRKFRNEPMSVINTFQKCQQCERVLMLLSFMVLDWKPGGGIPHPTYSPFCSECRFEEERIRQRGIPISNEKPVSPHHTGQEKRAESPHDFDGDGSMAEKSES